MGIGDWLRRHGPGSPGSVARAMARAYVHLKATSPNASRTEILSATLMSRYPPGRQFPKNPDLFVLHALEEIAVDSICTLSQLTAKVWREERFGHIIAGDRQADIYFSGVRIIEEEIRKIAPDSG